MVRIHADQSKLGSSPAVQARAKHSEQTRNDEINRTLHWPAVVIVATCRYLSEGIRILGQGYSTYDDRDPQ